MVCVEHGAGSAICALHVCTVFCLLLHAHVCITHAHRDDVTSATTPTIRDDTRSRSDPLERESESTWGAELGTEYLEELPATTQSLPQRGAAHRPYLRKLFSKYGHEGTLTFEGFEHLLHNLGLGNIVIKDHELHDHLVEGDFRDFHSNHDHLESDGENMHGSDHDAVHYGESSHGHDSQGDHDSHVEHNHGDSHVDHDHSKHSRDSDRYEIIHNQHNHDDLGDEVHDNHDHSSEVGHGVSESHSEETGPGSGQKNEHADHDQHDHELHEHDHDHESDLTSDLGPDNQDRSESHVATASHTRTSSPSPVPQTTPTADSEDLPSSPEPPGSHFSSDGPHEGDHVKSRREREISSTGESDLRNSMQATLEESSPSASGAKSPQTDGSKSYSGRSSDGSHVISNDRSVFADLPTSDAESDSGKSVQDGRNPKRRTGSGREKVVKRSPPEDVQCLRAGSLLSEYEVRSGDPITPEAFLRLCPAIIYQLDSRSCRKHADSHKQVDVETSRLHSNGEHDHHHDDDDAMFDVTATYTVKQIPAHVWGYAFLAVLVISLVGLLGVAVVPVMQKVFYNHLLQFLVALAVGSLVGDALLHLLPHSLVPHDDHGGHSLDDRHGHGADEGLPGTGSHDHGHPGHEEPGHSQGAIWLGCVAFAGIYFFFLTERLMGIFSKWRSDKNKKKKKRLRSPPKSPRLYRTEEEREQLEEVGMKLSQHEHRVKSCEHIMMVVHPAKASTLAPLAEPECIRDIVEDAHDEMEEIHRACDFEELHRTCADSSNQPHRLSENHSKENGHASGSGAGHSGDGHSHGHHGHTHELPNSVSAVAWMVIMGDGLHNFCDGLAIGAAFSNSVTGGLSTSIAVFCHELPHELGDFAVLLRAGMSVRNALMYNCVSSVLCLIGMIVGVCAGNIGSASLWIFALGAGMFIYIALVDMLPEMTAVDPKEGENPFVHLALQNAGLLSGAAIMLLIALYEHKIQIPHFEP